MPKKSKPHLHKLSEGDFQEEDGQPARDQADKVGNQESAASVLVAKVGKAPDVAQTDGEADARHEEIQLAAPTLPLRDLVQGRRRRGGGGRGGRGPVALVISFVALLILQPLLHHGHEPVAGSIPHAHRRRLGLAQQIQIEAIAGAISALWDKTRSF